MSEIKLKPCPFCGAKVAIDDISTEDEDYFMIQCQNEECGAAACFGDESETKEGAARAWNRRVNNKPIRQSCKSCKHYAPDPNYRNGDMGNCRYLEKIWEKPFYVNEARTECDHFQAAERINENGNET